MTQRTLLIAEDDPAALHLYENMLSGGSFRILTADNGNLLSFELEHETVDLLVADTRLVDLPLAIWMGRIYRKRPGLPIILVDDGLSDIRREQAANEFGIKAYLRKPLNLWALNQIIAEIIFPSQLTRC